ncbi:MAG: hypothetical protein ACR2PR_10100 [Pseudohongiellaceae bacterium]
MTVAHDNKHRNLTFSQREGKEPVIEPVLEKLSDTFRNRLWLVMDVYLNQVLVRVEHILPRIRAENRILWAGFIRSYWMNVLELPHDGVGLPSGPDRIKDFWRKSILFDKYHVVLSLLEHFLQYDSPRWDNLKKAIKEVIDEHTLYFIDDAKQPVCIMPVVSEESKKALKHSIEVLHDNEKAAAVNYFHSAAEKINESQWQDAVRNSINAVESVARSIAPEAKTLGEALTKLKGNELIEHPALAKAFSSLYGYTNDRPNIRHAEVFAGGTPVERDEAIFMFGACASFAAYLTMKQKQLESN